MQQTIREIARCNLIDEVRFIDAEALTAEHLGDPARFAGRQPREVMPEANSIIMVSIYIGKFVSPASREHGRMSRLVLSGFYANIVKPLAPIRNCLEAQGHRACIIDGVMDANLLPIKGAAVKAGLGWIGKNTLLVNEKYGSFQALGAILTDAVLGEEYAVAPNRCGTCSRCMEACPSNAIETPRHLHQGKCLSHILDGGQGEGLPEDVDLQGYFLECDICQNACPWNRRHIENPLDTPDGRLYDMSEVEPLLRMERLETMDPDTYENQLVPWMGDGPISYRIFQRNLSAIKRTTH